MPDNAPSGVSPNKPAPKSADHPARKEHHWGTWGLILLVIVLGVGAFFFFRPKKTKPPPPPAVPITFTRVKTGDIPVSVSSLGSVLPVYTASISPRVDGQVITVNYTEGQMVASNDLLAVIDPGPYAAVLTQAQGQLERDTNMLAGANVDLQRYQAAYVKKAIPKQQVDDQLALVHQDEGTVRLDEGTVASAKVNVEYCYIRAPFAGRVGLRLVDPGNVVHAANSNAIVVVAQLQPITVVFNVAEDYLPQIQQQLKQGHDMTVEAWDRAEENKLATGKVLALDNMIDTATGTVKLKAIFDNEDLSLFPNQFVNAKLIIEVLHNQNLVPTFAIQHNPEGAFVYMITNRPPTNSLGTNRMSSRGGAESSGSPNETGKNGPGETRSGTTNAPGTNVAWVTMVTITTGTTDGNTTAVTQGLKPGGKIALDNFNKLGEGVKVTTHPETPPGGEGAGAGKHRGGSNGKKTDETTENP